MASDTISTPQMIVPYEWILENVEEEPMTITSKMILFRGEKIFRVGLKNHTQSPILFLMAIDLGKIGMKVQDVKYGIQGSGSSPATMMEMSSQSIGEEGSLQLFTIKLAEKVVGHCTFMFRIWIEGAYPGYSYQLCDRLAKDQLWAAKEELNLADVDFVVKDKSFPAHKAILAARSRVFEAEFKKKQPVKGGPHQIRIDGVEPSTVENFLHFVYTGEPIGTLADEDLLKLADRYRLTTLTDLCRVALEKIDAMRMEQVRRTLNNNAEELSSSKIMPKKETEIFFDRTTPTFRCPCLLKSSEHGQTTCVMQYQKEDICVAYYIGEIKKDGNNLYISKPEIHLSCAKHRRFGLKVEDIYCRHLGYNHWFKMEPKNSRKNAELLHFAAQSDFVYLDLVFHTPLFDVKVISTIGNYYYEMMDDSWLMDFWTAATNRKLTDVEIFVGTVKVMEAHRIILCARSPVLNESITKISNATKSIVTFGAEFEVDTVETFLNFLYTGSLKTTGGGQQLSKLATMYEVETLKNVCQLMNPNSSDVEELTNGLIQL